MCDTAMITAIQWIPKGILHKTQDMQNEILKNMT